ncbi:AfsR/SARP family transcriptional regulator [Streptomyces sp. NBC_00989]|uniref:AfsR/SARP family transcriptional regulator n=1 Tax=Streptomyces sp. NBC_00989 TaxID=2903705 RepID=UPI0038672FA3|nr:winged helix-turn-helix domain-containing protein [Streptomyces sp. NBC_00989]
MSDDALHLRLLGRLELADGSGAVTLPGAVSRAIVGRLLLAGGAVVHRDTLIDELWEEHEAKDPVNALQVQVTKLRAALAKRGRDGRLQSQHGGYRFVLGPEDQLDTVRFEATVREGREHLAAGAYRQAEGVLRQGLALWRGRALDDLKGRVFDAERLRLEELRLGAQEDAGAAGLELGRAAELVPELTALVSAAPLRERSRARLMLALHRCGRNAEALDVYESGRGLLRSELGADPSPELRSLHDAILAGDPRPGTAPADTVRLSPAPAASRPAPGDGGPDHPLGPFVGRGEELDGLRAALDRERLVTVVGTGGVGKTRLALEACLLMQSSCDGVWWVDLVSADGAGVLAAIAGALGLSDASVRPDQPPHDYVHRLTSFLAGRRAMLVLDNCEHLLDAVAPLVAVLLGRCPALTVLATSRAPLAVAGETLYPLVPMPDAEAADLFSTRALMIDPSFTPDETAMHDIRSLCRRLDGLPLAVELAAAHVRLLPVREIELRLDNRFTLLAKGKRTAPARHRTLRAVLDWSYALLDTTEQRVLTELALYVGGCSVELAETTMLPPETDCPGVDHHEILQVLAQLVDKSLLFTVSTPDGTRLRLLETVREYALDRLRAEGRAAEAEERFMAWALRFVRDCTDANAPIGQGELIRRHTGESANIRAASDLMMARSRTAQALSLESRRGSYWIISGREEEGIDRLQRSVRALDTAEGQRAAAQLTEGDEQALFYALAWLVWLNHVVGRYVEGGHVIDRFKAAWRQAKNPNLAVLGPCYEPLHAMLAGRDDVEELFVRAEEGVAGTEFHWDRAILLTNWTTYCLQAGDIDGARGHGRAAVAAAIASGDDFARACALTLRGDADESAGLRDRARAHWSEAARILRSIGARGQYAYAALRIVCLDIAEGAVGTAENRLAEVVRLADELSADDLRAAAAILRGTLAFYGGRFSDARTIFADVWDSPTAPLDRRAMSAVGLVAVTTFGPPAPSAADDARMWMDRAGEALDRVREPLARRAVGALLGKLDAYFKSGPSGAIGAEHVQAWLSNNPSLLAGFTGVLNGPGRHR